MSSQPMPSHSLSHCEQGSFQHRWGEPLLPAERGTIVMTQWHTLLLQSDSFQRRDDGLETHTLDGPGSFRGVLKVNTRI